MITQVTWSGGHVPTEEDSLFQFLAQPAKAGTYTFQVRADLLGRVDRRLVGAGVVGRAGADDRGRQLGRRRRHLDADDRRARCSVRSACSSADRPLLAGRPALT